MSKKKNNDVDLTLSEKQEFVDIMDEHIGDGSIHPKHKSQPKPVQGKKSKDESSGLELLGFLENENMRLKKVNELVSNKLPNKALYPQSDRLIEKQLNTNLMNREDLIFRISENTSDLNMNLKEIWNLHFQNS